jgi:hypothetical protein
MSASERRSAIKRKRAAQGGKLHKDAVHVATFADALKKRK